MVWGSISAYGMGSLHVLEDTKNAERYIKVLEQHMLPSRRRLFQGRPCVFQQDNANHILQLLQQHGLNSELQENLTFPKTRKSAYVCSDVTLSTFLRQRQFFTNMRPGMDLSFRTLQDQI